MLTIKKTIITLFFIYLLHYLLIHFYIHYCLPFGFTGFFKSIVYSVSPICITLQWVTSYTINCYHTIAIGLIIFIINSCNIFKNNLFLI